MSGSVGSTLAVAAAVGAGLTGGVYTSFAVMVLPALRAVPPAHAVATMQRINAAAVRPPFMVLFFGSSAASAGLITAELASGAFTLRTAVRLVGAGLSLAAFGITAARNVPLNSFLARLDPAADPSAGWRAFDEGWGRANILRAGAAGTGSAFLAASLLAAPD